MLQKTRSLTCKKDLLWILMIKKDQKDTSTHCSTKLWLNYWSRTQNVTHKPHQRCIHTTPRKKKLILRPEVAAKSDILCCMLFTHQHSWMLKINITSMWYYPNNYNWQLMCLITIYILSQCSWRTAMSQQGQQFYLLHLRGRLYDALENLIQASPHVICQIFLTCY